MPHIPTTFPGSPRYQINGHWQTVWPSLFRKVPEVAYTRERMDTPDGDFLDLDWVNQEEATDLVILSHGLEGSTDRKYIRGMARAFAQKGWDVLAWNCRSCSGEINRTSTLYHHGDTKDIGLVVDHALRQKAYDQVYLIGFSMGGAMTLKYLGVQGSDVHHSIKGGIGFSVPCDLKAGAEALEIHSNGFYKRRFFRKLKAKMLAKEAQFPGLIDPAKFDQVRSWRDFDAWFSTPVAGYETLDDFYHHSSCQHFMANSRVPLLVVNAINDPILLPACTPHDLAQEHDHIFVEETPQGGHVGFQDRHGGWWMEKRALRAVANRRSEVNSDFTPPFY